MVHVMHVHFGFFAFFKNLKTSYSIDNLPEHVGTFSLKMPPKWFRLSH